MGKYSKKSNLWLAKEIQQFTDQPHFLAEKSPEKFNIWKVLPRLAYFLALVLEFLIRIQAEQGSKWK